PQVVEPETERLIEQRTESLLIALEHDPSQILSLKFLEKRSNRDNKSWYQAAEQDVVWERWEISFSIQPWNAYIPNTRLPNNEFNKPNQSIQSQLHQFLERLILFVVSQREHIPPITSSDVMPFPVDVCILFYFLFIF
ncbi:hypothetical protein BY996DRAFT_4589330, partial [Phakopsora pachyrhizi]